MNYSIKPLRRLFAIRPQLVSGGCLVLVVFLTLLLFVNLLLNGIFFSKFWPSFGLALAVFSLGTVMVSVGFRKFKKSVGLFLRQLSSALGQ